MPPLTGVRSKLVRLRAQKPHWSLGDFALELGVSRERVRQILASEGLHTRRITPKSIFDAALDNRDVHAYDSPAEDDPKVRAGQLGAPYSQVAWLEAMAEQGYPPAPDPDGETPETSAKADEEDDG